MFEPILLGLALAMAPSPDPAELATVRPFLLHDLDGERVRLSADGQRATVVCFTAPGDDSAADLELVAELAADDAEEGFRFLVVVPGQHEATALRSWQEECGLRILPDPLQGLTDAWGITRLGSALVVDGRGGVWYRGPIEGDEFSVLDGIEAVRMGEPIEEEIAGSGAPLVALAARGDEVPLEFHRDIAPILNRHCVQCHREGQIGPMVLNEVDEVRGWAPMVAEVVEEQRMPPWSANPRHGDFRNARGLSENEKAALIHWARIGAPAGDPALAPEAPRFPESWQIGTPDVVYELPQEQPVPATGVVPYRYVMLDPQIAEDRWVQAIEVRHTAPEVTHHVLVYLIPPGMNWRRFLGSQSDLGNGLLVGVAPGNPPDVFEPGLARRIPAGSRFLFQLHYTPNGEPAVDRSQVGIRWADPASVEAEIVTHGITNYRIDIAPHQDDQSFQARLRVKEDSLLLGMTPHMHARGKSFRYELLSLEAEDRILLDVPAYDFNWQHNYLLRAPLAVEAGDTFLLTATYDNSADNPFNPDPAARVRWGDQTFEEMFLGWVYFRVPLTQGAE